MTNSPYIPAEAADAATLAILNLADTVRDPMPQTQALVALEAALPAVHAAWLEEAKERLAALPTDCDSGEWVFRDRMLRELAALGPKEEGERPNVLTKAEAQLLVKANEQPKPDTPEEEREFTAIIDRLADWSSYTEPPTSIPQKDRAGDEP